MSRQTDTDRITEKIAALLRLAEGAATDGEREAALDLPVLLPEQRTKANLAELLARPAADRGLVTEAL